MIIYAMRHGQKAAGKDPLLTEKGKWQMHETTEKYLPNSGISRIFCGNLYRHRESAHIASKRLGIQEFAETHLLTIDGTPAIEDINRCVAESLKHPGGNLVGFLVDNWFKLNPDMMAGLWRHFGSFVRSAVASSTRNTNILAISSSPLIEAATPNPTKTWLLGETGIIKYIVDYEHEAIIGHEIIFDGFY